MSHSHHKTSQHSCPACSYGPFLRNNYFNGKLMVERDFTDETRFHMEKLRHHEQLLHGTGVVCGLKVKPHPNDACRDRFVCIGPGFAVDCCGRDIIVREEECIDLLALPEIQALKKQEDNEAHKLQICVRFRECPTEEIPVLYDDCGCDDTKCAPNRILESYEVGVILDARDEEHPFHTPRLELENHINIGRAAHLALNAPSKRLYVVTEDAPSTVHQVSTEHNGILTSRSLSSKALAVAVSNDGSQVYVVAESATAGNPPDLHVLNASGLSDFSTSPITQFGSGNKLNLAVSADGRLLALVESSGDLLAWDDLDTNTSPVPSLVISLGANAQALALTDDGKRAYSVRPNGEIKEVEGLDTTSPSADTISILPAGAKPTSITLVGVSGHEMLAVAELTSKKLHLVGIGATPVLRGSVDLNHEPIALVASPGGHWIYALEKDATGSFLQPISVVGLQKTPPEQPQTEFKVGTDSQQVAITKSGKRLYISNLGDPSAQTPGAVAIVDVSEEACDEILWRHLEGCPHCDLPDCVVLATIDNYHHGDRILGATDPPDPDDDLENGIARINNRLGRNLLPSTQVLTELIQCLMEHGSEGAGGPGLPGKDGLGIDAVAADIVDCLQPGSAQIQMIGTQRTLVLEIPRGCDAVVPAPPKLAHLCNINWPHGEKLSQNDQSRLQDGGLLIAFDRDVISADINPHSFIVETVRRNDQDGTLCWCEVPQEVVRGVRFSEQCRIERDFDLPAGNQSANGAQFIPRIRFIPGQEYRVLLKGDFIRDFDEKKALDADHLPPWFPTANYTSGNGIAGGTFESWFIF